MYNFGACPRCQLEIQSERLRSSVIVCNHCGFTGNLNQRKLEKSAEKKFITIATSVCALLTFSFVMIVKWDTYSLEVLPLKAKQLVGMSSAEDLKRIVEICEDRKNLECQISGLEDLSKIDNEARAQLGKIYFLKDQNKLAVQRFSDYFRNGGLSFEASYMFARSLEKDGQIELASQYYESVLNSKPDTLQITVTRHYINMLTEYNKRDQAKLVLSKIREMGANTKNFMDPVFKELERSVQ